MLVRGMVGKRKDLKDARIIIISINNYNITNLNSQ